MTAMHYQDGLAILTFFGKVRFNPLNRNQTMPILIFAYFSYRKTTIKTWQYYLTMRNI